MYAVSTMANANRVLVVSVWSETNGAAPLVQVYDKNGTLLPGAALIQNSSGTILQVEGLQAWTTYYVKVQSANPAAWTARESYRFGIDFRNQKIALDSLVAGKLTAAAPQVHRTLQVERSQSFEFELSALSLTDTKATAARITVFDSKGTVAFTMVAMNRATVRGTVLLAPDTYTIVIVGATIDKSPLKGLQIDARFMTLTDPIGPALADPYATTAPTGTTTTGYVWIAPATFGVGYLAPTDPYSSPWW